MNTLPAPAHRTTITTRNENAIPLDYRALVGDRAWNRLPHAAQLRFSAHAAEFRGRMRLRASLCGYLLAHLCCLIGSPLPAVRAAVVDTTVSVAPDPSTGGSRWTRRYHFDDRRAIEVASVKAVDRDGSLVERLGAGLRMKLDIFVEDRALHFSSTAYCFDWLGLRFDLPSWWLPGRTHVVHRDLGDGRFEFVMTIRHRLLGELFHHVGIFSPIGDRSWN